jgi:hypothetical protein
MLKRGVNLFLLPILLGILVNFVYDKLTERKREPTFIVNPLKSRIIQQELLKDRPIAVVDRQGNEIKEDVHIVTFYFFNNGAMSIRDENVLKPFKIYFSNKNRLLDFNILKKSRELCGINVSPYDSIKGIWTVGFTILEEGDGFTAQIIYSGKDDTDLRIDGVVEGASNINSQNDLNYSKVGLLTSLAVVLVFIATFFILLSRKIEESSKRTLGERLTVQYELVIRNTANRAEKSTVRFTYARLMVISGALFLLLFVGSMLLSQTLLAKWFDPKYKPTNIENVIIPKSILPDLEE